MRIPGVWVHEIELDHVLSPCSTTPNDVDPAVTFQSSPSLVSPLATHIDSDSPLCSPSQIL